MKYFKILSNIFILLTLVASVFFSQASKGYAQTQQDWSDPINLSLSGSAIQPILVVDFTGTIHVIWVDTIDDEYKYRRSADGNTWAPPQTVKFPFDPKAPFPILLADANGSINVFWMLFGYTGEYDVYKYSPARARELLKQAGSPNLKFALLHSPGRYLMSTEVVEAIKANLAAVGVDMTIQNMEWGAFSQATSTKLKDNRMEASLNWWRSINGNADSAIAEFATKFFPPGNNTAFFSNAQYDKLYAQEQAETNQTRREQQLKEMHKILMEEMPAVPLYRQPNLWVAGAGLTN